MKTKKVSRVLALLLSLVMLLGALPMTALAESGETVLPNDKYDELLRQSAQVYFERLMATETLQEAEQIAGEIQNDQGVNFFNYISDGQKAELEEKYDTLVAEYEASLNPEESEEDDDRTIVYPAVDYTDAAPFGDPVEGVAPVMFALMRTAAVAEEKDNGLSLDKYISEPDENGVYTLTLEAWATGEKVTSVVTEEIPTDIVLVLDQSGSMAYDFASVIYEKYTGTPAEMYTNRNDLYVKLSNGGYAPVSVSRATVSVEGYSLYSGQTNSTYHDNKNNLYHKCSDGRFGKVTISRTQTGGMLWWKEYDYSYTCANGCTLGSGGDSDAVPSFNGSLYVPASGQQYTFTYTNESDQTVTTTVMETESVPNWDFHLAKEGGSTNRLDALRDAVTVFANSVAAKTTETVDHRIAVVGFSSSGYSNTEILTGCTITTGNKNYGTEPFIDNRNNGTGYFPTGYAKNGVQYGGNGYTNACTTALVAANSNSVKDAIGALTAYGGTQTADGVEMAKNILDANPVPAGKKRNRVVIVFSDGIPGNQGYDTTVANNAISKAQALKNAGVTVYTVGIFDGADATEAGSLNTNQDADKGNYFMQRLSSNTEYPQTPSYYLSASNASALNNIFKTISENIESGGSITTLDENTVIKDVLTDQFVLPDGVDADDIVVYTSAVDATNGSFTEPVVFDGAVKNISNDGKSITVSNFDFADNWVGKDTAADNTVTYHGKKLIIQIPIEVRDGFLGGNQVVTNAAGSAVYRNAEAVTKNDPFEAFVSPTVDVEIGDITVAAPDYNVYLYGGVTTAQIEQKTVITVGDVSLDMDAENYGLDEWQHAYVTIDDNNTATENYENLTADKTTYTITCTVEPKTTGEATSKSGNGTGAIYVFKPELTFQDTQVDYLSTIANPGYYNSSNKVGNVDWVCAAEGSDKTQLPESAPAVDLTYTADSGIDGSGKVVSTTDVLVNVAVTVGGKDATEHTTFKHEPCTFERDDAACKWNAETSEFLLHVINVIGDLKITKQFDNCTPAEGETFKFTIVGEGVNMEVIIKGNDSIVIKDLKLGQYTVTENDKWSWRYTATSNKENNEVTVTADDKAEIIFTNTLTKNQWLDGSAYAENSWQNGNVDLTGDSFSASEKTN